MRQAFKGFGFTKLSFFLALFASVAGSAFAQSTAQITGTITDSSAAAIPEAKIVVINEGTGARSETTSNAAGNYSVLFLQPGSYRVEIQKPSFRTVSRSGMQLQVAQAASVNFQLELGSVAESVNVTDTAPLLDATAAAFGGVVSSDKIENAPMKGRNSNAFMMLEPGVRMPRGTANQPVLESHFQFFSISGGRPGQNQFLLDGANDNNVGFNGPEYSASVEAVQEYRVQTNSYAAEYSNYSGGVINTVTKSGTNQFHGSVFEFVRNDAFEATPFFSNATNVKKAALKMNQFGVAVGGPIRKNKTFFFFAYEGLIFRIPAGGAVSGAGLPGVTSLPVALQRTGDFSKTLTSTGALVTIFDPTSTRQDPNNPANYIRTPFSSNAIPATKINPVAAAIIKYYPQPNTAGDPFTGLNNFRISSSEPESDNNYSLKMDHRFNDSTAIMGRYSEALNSNQLPNVYGNAADPFNSLTLEHHASGVISLTKTFSATWLGEFVGSWNRFTYNIQSAGAGFDPTQLGFPGYVSGHAFQTGFPQITIDSQANVGGYSFAHDAYYRPEARASVTRFSGQHTLKFGGLFGWGFLDSQKYSNNTGTYGFNKTFTQGPNPLVASAGYGLATFLLGTPTSGTYYPTTLNTANLTKYTGFFVQDDYKVTARLTLNLGLRWDYEAPRTERFNRIGNFDFNTASTLPNGARLRGGLAFPNVGGLSRGQWNDQRARIAPRFGFAYGLTNNTILRGGYGIFYGNSGGSAPNGNQLPNPGFTCSTPVTASFDGGLTPAASLSNPFPTGFCNPTGSSAGLQTNLGQSLFLVDRNHKILYTESWNFDIQHKLPLNVLFEIAYTGNRGIHLPGVTSIDQLAPQYQSLGSQLNSPVPNPFFGVITQGNLSGPTITLGQSLLPYPQFLNAISVTNTYGASTYHALYGKVEHRFSKGFSILGSYTYSKLIDDVVASPTGFAGETFQTGSPQNYYNLKGDRSIAGFNTPQTLVASSVYELPFGPGKQFLNGGGAAGKVIGGWQVNAIVTLQSGEPLQISGGSTSPLNTALQRPNWTGKNATLSGRVQGRLGAYFDTTQFSLNAPFTFGNAPRIMPNLYGPGQKNFDLSVFKNTTIKERFRLQFRAEAFNALNRVQFGNPGANITQATFGRISTQANLPRDIQLALKLLF